MATSTIPLARGLPVVGSVFDMARDMRAFLTDNCLEHGPVYGMRLLNRRFTVLAGVEANRFLARHGTKHFRSFEFWSGFNAWFGAARSTLSADGAEHAAFRRTLKRGYSREYAVEHMGGMIDIARREIAAWPQGRPMAAGAGSAAARHRSGWHAGRRRLAASLQRRPRLLRPRAALGHHRAAGPTCAGRRASAARRRRWTSSTTRSSSATRARCASGTVPSRT